MPGPSLNSYDHEIEAHEERLQRVEGALQDVAVQVGRVDTKQDMMVAQIDGGFKRLEATLEKVHSKAESLSLGQESLRDRLAPLEEKAAIDASKAAESRGNWKSIWIGVALAAAGGLVTKGGELLWSFFAHK
jgi:septal ring factor EnvC (AmiA/AmiB activator)